MRRYDVSTGTSVEGNVEVLREGRLTQAERTRGRLAYATLGLGAMFLIGAAVLGVLDGSFDELIAVWSAVGPIAAYIFGTYFKGGGDGTGTG